MKTRLPVLVFCLLVIVGCKAESKPYALSFEVYTSKETRYEVVALVEKFALRENLILSTSYNHPTPDESSVSMDYADEAQKNAWMFVSNGNLKNKDHVEVNIATLPAHKKLDNKECNICKRFEASDEMKQIQEKFEISTVVRNGDWWK